MKQLRYLFTILLFLIFVAGALFTRHSTYKDHQAIIEGKKKTV